MTGARKVGATTRLKQSLIGIIYLALVLMMTLASCGALPDTIPPTREISIPTITITPSTTLNPTITHTPSPASTPTATSYPTPGPDYNAFFFRDELESPDGKWVAIFTDEYHAEEGIANIKIYDEGGLLLWTITTNLTEEQIETSPTPWLRIHHWAPDSSRLYYYYIMGWDGAATLIDGYGLTELNIFTGEKKSLLPNGFVDFSFSPQHAKLAYILKGLIPKEIIIRDLLTGVERKTPLPIGDQIHEQAGWINWAKDGKSLIFFMVNSFLNYQIYYMEIETMKPRLLFEDTWVDWISSSWSDEDTLIILLYSDSGLLIEIDMMEGRLLGVATETPEP